MAFQFIIYAIILGAIHVNSQSNATFSTYYTPLWGSDHLTVNPEGTEVQLKIDQSSGAGFRSISDFGSGLFHIRMKIPENKTGGILTTFYLTSAPNGQPLTEHFELDFEFIGTTGRLKTNVFNNDWGVREQIFQLGFDPSEDYHTYEILWNWNQIVWFVDNIPIRVFRNNTAQGLTTYFSEAMHIEGSIWEAGRWAGVADWSLGPFVGSYEDFAFGACTVDAQSVDISECASGQYFWNGANYLELSDDQKQQMSDFRSSYLVSDYCSDPNLVKPECAFNI